MNDDDAADKKFNPHSPDEGWRPILGGRKARALQECEREENLFTVSLVWVCMSALILTLTGVIASIASQYLV